jgi:hypothetical protein
VTKIRSGGSASRATSSGARIGGILYSDALSEAGAPASTHLDLMRNKPDRAHQGSRHLVVSMGTRARRRGMIAVGFAAPVCALLAAYATAIAEPIASSIRVSEIKCHVISENDVRHHLTLDEQEEIAMGTWGRSVHPLGPDYFRLNRDQRSQGKSDAACKP